MPYATSAIPWPMDAAPSVKIDFSTSEPLGAALRTTDFSDEVRFTNGERVPVGSLVEAYVDDALCEMASIRSGGFTGYISVVGPDSRPECECHEGDDHVPGRRDAGRRNQDQLPRGVDPPRSHGCIVVTTARQRSAGLRTESAAVTATSTGGSSSRRRPA